jgi:hypothetical protein
MDLDKIKGISGLHNLVINQGFYSGKLKLLITTECEFEGFSGRASETWENITTIEIVSPQSCKIPSIKVVGKPYQHIDEVANVVLGLIKKKIDDKN